MRCPTSSSAAGVRPVPGSRSIRTAGSQPFFGREELALGTVLDLAIPPDPSRVGESIWVEARWIDGLGRQRGASEPLELLLPR